MEIGLGLGAQEGTYCQYNKTRTASATSTTRNLVVFLNRLPGLVQKITDQSRFDSDLQPSSYLCICSSPMWLSAHIHISMLIAYSPKSGQSSGTMSKFSACFYLSVCTHTTYMYIVHTTYNTLVGKLIKIGCVGGNSNFSLAKGQLELKVSSP